MSVPFDEIIKKSKQTWDNVLQNNPFAQQVSTSAPANPFDQQVSNAAPANPFLQAIGGNYVGFGQTADPYRSFTSFGSEGGNFGSLFTQGFGGGGFREWKTAKTQQQTDANNSTNAGVDLTGADPNGARGLEGTYQWDSQIKSAAEKYGVPPEVIRAIMGIESGGDPNSVSVAGAMGLMQVMPMHYNGTGLDGMDPTTSINKGTEILAENFRAYGSWDLAAAAYLGAIGQDANGNWVVTDAPDAYGTTGNHYVQLFKNNLAAQGWGQQQAPGGSTDYDGSIGSGAVRNAESLIGQPYVLGGESYEEGGFDCSGLTQYSYAQMGIQIPRTAQEQYNGASRFTDANQLQAGDLIFFGTPDNVFHVAIYAGNGYIIDAPDEGKTIRKIPLNTPWYQENMLGFGRYATGNGGYATNQTNPQNNY